MPIKKSAIKKARQDKTRKQRNKLTKILFRSKIKETKTLAENGNVKEANTSLSQAFSAIDKAAKKGVIHKNTAARKKSRLAKAIAAASEVKEEAKTVRKTTAKKVTKKTTKKTAK